MDQQASTAASYVVGDKEEWELCNDGGFVYKRTTCLGEEETSTAAGGEASNPVMDTVEEEINQRKRKREIFVNLKRKYQRESFIHHWEVLSNRRLQFQPLIMKTSYSVETRGQVEKDTSLVVHELLSMEEAREGVYPKCVKRL